MKSSQHRCQYTRSVRDSQSERAPGQILVAGPRTVVSEAFVRSLDGVVLGDSPLSALRALSPDQVKAQLTTVSHISLLIFFLDPSEDGDWLSLLPWIWQRDQKTRLKILVCMERQTCPSEESRLEIYDINEFIVTREKIFHPLEQLVRTALSAVRPPPGPGVKPLRERHTHSMLEEEKAFCELIETIGNTLWETGETHCFVLLSSNAEQLYGYTAKELTGKPFDHAMDQETRTGVWPDISDAMAEQRPFTNLTISRRHKTGEPKYFLTSGRPVFDDQGNWRGFRGTEKDITALITSEQEKEKLIAQLRHAQRLEAMGTLAGGIAHDFNNILGGILGYTQLIQFEIKENPVALAHTNHIIAGCNRAKDLILKILDFSRQRESTTTPKLTVPGEIVGEAIKLLRASTPPSIRLKTKIEKDAGLILADPVQIHQAIMNLCTNARQAMESGQGCITVHIASVSLTPENHSRSPELDLECGEYVTISVTDTGRGIETNTLEKIFNPYFTTKKRGDGSGLGLSVVHGIVARLNGTISVSSTPGKGSTFTLYFPRHLEQEPPEKEHRIRLVGGKSNVLFIDDDPMLVDIGRMMLEKLGYQVTALDTPLKGLNMIAAEPDRFDIVITDMTMPEILGTQLALRIKQLNSGLSVVLATGFSNIVQTREATPEGIDAVLPKPITMASLSQTLHQLLTT